MATQKRKMAEKSSVERFTCIYDGPRETCALLSFNFGL